VQVVVRQRDCPALIKVMIISRHASMREWREKLLDGK
jgi:hypothetical protein